MIRVKICGITTIEDALFCIAEGVCALGFNFYLKSPRYIDPLKANEIIRQLPPFVSAVGLFVNEDINSVENIIKLSGIDTVQFHGDETADYCRHFKGIRIIKAFRIKKKDDMKIIFGYDVNGYLLDSYHPRLYGGTGLAFSWDILKSLSNKDRIIVAGGIKPDNVANLLQNVTPYGIDICSGVEKKPGLKDKTKIKEMMKIVVSRNFCDA